ncbi:RidA family protein [Alcaligenaceae bacterium CGII-47]|nr:RidA family protein [Alcaligenaceae bacterium CGII-47]
MVNKKSIPFGDGMGMKVAFCNAIAAEESSIKRQIWVSGQIAIDEKGTLVGKGDMAAQTEQVIKNLQTALKEFDATLDDIVQVVVYVTDMSSLKSIHDVRLKYFNSPYPTSTLIQVSGFVNPDALIEISAIAVV